MVPPPHGIYSDIPGKKAGCAPLSSSPGRPLPSGPDRLQHGRGPDDPAVGGLGLLPGQQGGGSVVPPDLHGDGLGVLLAARVVPLPLGQQQPSEPCRLLTAPVKV